MADFLHFWSGDGWVYVGAFFLVLSVLVFVHEWGHYIIARLCGVRVETFSIGFGREILGFNDSHGTRWKFSLIPLGGYVKLFGDVDPASTKGSDEILDEKTGQLKKMTKKQREVAFFNKPVWKRAAIVFAGPAINYLFAIVLLAGLYGFYGQPVTPPVGAAVMVGSPADKHDFRPHDKILTIDGKTIESFEDVRREMMIALDEERRFVIERDGKIIDIYASPERLEIEDRFGFKHSQGLLGLLNSRYAVKIDNIATIDGNLYKNQNSLRRVLNGKMGTVFKIGVRNGEKIEELLIKPTAENNKDIMNPAGTDYSLLHIAGGKRDEFVRYSAPRALWQATKESWVITRGTLEALGQMVVGTRSATELGGIIRIGAIAGDMAQQGILAIILFTALLSINLGLINLFPIPVLDGGHLLFYFFEAVRGKPVPEKIQDFAFQAGFTFLICIMVFANLNDLIQILL